MKVLILGVDGYIGWPLAQYLHHHGFDVIGIDDVRKRRIALLDGARSAIETASFGQRCRGPIKIMKMNAARPDLVSLIMEREKPDAVVNLAQLPSAPYSMRSPLTSIDTHVNNCSVVLSVLWAIKTAAPESHLVHIGTLGEYGTPSCPIPEGWFEHEGDRMLFPRRPSSLYHSAKVASTYDIEAACRFWGLRATDIMQGPVYGIRFDGKVEGKLGETALWVDETWGTVLNRFCAQAVLGEALTVYGKGGQTRGILPLADSLQCLRLLVEAPAGVGEYRCVNQFDRSYSVTDLAILVQRVATRCGLPDVHIEHVENPRIEAEEHFYAPVCDTLPRLGYTPLADLEGEVLAVLEALSINRSRLECLRGVLMPTTSWR